MEYSRPIVLCHAEVMRVLGVDLAAQPIDTGAVLLESVGGHHWVARALDGPADDTGLVQAAIGIDVIGVDSPLGWPVAFVAAVAAHSEFRRWPGVVDRAALTHRDTDRAIRDHGVRASLSVSADKLGSVAMRCALLQQRWADEVWGRAAPRDGSGPLVETYPAAAFAAWGITIKDYKNRREPLIAADVRRGVIREIGDVLGVWLDLEPVADRCVSSDHILDALVSALVALAVRSGATHLPSPPQRAVALIEGWIHVPSRPLAELAPLDGTDPLAMNSS